MEAIRFKSVCNKCDDNSYASTTSIVDRINEKLQGFDPHSAARISVLGTQTGRYVKLSLKGEAEEFIDATENVFKSAGYFTLVEKNGDESVMYVIFDSDIAPGDEDEDEDDAPVGSGPIDPEEPAPEVSSTPESATSAEAEPPAKGTTVAEESAPAEESKPAEETKAQPSDSGLVHNGFYGG